MHGIDHIAMSNANIAAVKPSRATVWIACLVMLMASLAPSVSHLLAAARGVPPMLAEICGVGGARVVRLDISAAQSVSPDNGRFGVDDAARLVDLPQQAYLTHDSAQPRQQRDAGGGTDHHAAFNLDHCPFCYTQAHLPALLPPTAFAAVLHDADVEPLPRLFYRASIPLFAWASAQPRAPPLLS